MKTLAQSCQHFQYIRHPDHCALSFIHRKYTLLALPDAPGVVCSGLRYVHPIKSILYFYRVHHTDTYIYIYVGGVVIDGSVFAVEPNDMKMFTKISLNSAIDNLRG